MAVLHGLCLSFLYVGFIGMVYSDVCSNVANPDDSTSTMPSCELDQQSDIDSIPNDVQALELKFTQLNTIDFSQFSLTQQTLTHLVFHMTYLSYNDLKRAMNGISAPNLETVLVKRDLQRDGSSLYIDAQTFSTLSMVQTLNLKGVGIGILHDQALRGLFRLETLDLSENNLQEIPEYALQDCHNLTIIRLQGNFIEPQYLLENSFTGPRNLHWLNLEKNKISYVPANRFIHLSSLTILVLTDNAIEFIEPEAFRGLTDLHLLSLSNNKLSSVPTEALEDIPNLYSLDLSLNELDDLEHGSFHSLANLEVLYLQYTNLGDLSGESFRGLDKLREIHLKRNQIQSVNASTFAHVPEVMSIDLSNNMMKDVAVDTFTRLQHLKVLDLSDNELRHLEEGLFEGLTLDELYLAKNRWNCTCELLWLFQWIHDNEDQLKNDHELYTIQCTTPQKYQHYKFYDLRMSFVMNCQEDLTLVDYTTEAHSTSSESDGLSDQALAGIIAAAVILIIIIVFIVLLVVYVRHKKNYRFWKPSQPNSPTNNRRPSDIERQQRLERHRTPSWCKDPEPVPAVPPRSGPPPSAAHRVPALPPHPEASAPPDYTPEAQDNKVNDVFAFDNMALESSMLSQNGLSPTKSNGNAASPSKVSYGHPTSTSSPRDHTPQDINVHINVDINKNMNGS